LHTAQALSGTLSGEFGKVRRSSNAAPISQDAQLEGSENPLAQRFMASQATEEGFEQKPRMFG